MPPSQPLMQRQQWWTPPGLRTTKPRRKFTAVQPVALGAGSSGLQFAHQNHHGHASARGCFAQLFIRRTHAVISGELATPRTIGHGRWARLSQSKARHCRPHAAAQAGHALRLSLQRDGPTTGAPAEVNDGVETALRPRIVCPARTQAARPAKKTRQRARDHGG